MATTVNYYDVPLKRLNSQNALGLGVVFTDFENAKIELCKWPTSGKRPLISSNYSGGGGCKLGNMEEKLTIAGVEIPREDWEKTPANVKELILHLEQRLTTIEERLGLNSK
ncbi:MAG: hypothetical protein F6K53_40170, partial [Moorea sp. SIO4A1]